MAVSSSHRRSSSSVPSVASSHRTSTTGGSDDDSDAPKQAKNSTKGKAPKRPLKAGVTSGAGGSGGNLFLTAAEQREAGKKADKKQAEDPYSFLLDVRDKDGVRPGEPNYDARTLLVPKSAWKEFTPFEKQVSRFVSFLICSVN